ncbi:MAG TPA: acetolactate synthase large subunit [Streptosporangiaceae bacterium]
MISKHYSERRVLTGAEALLGTAVRTGMRVCFANPGTTEMPLVAALDSTAGIRAVLGLHENVCTGAADGYARMTRRPAMTLLHLGPGLANGLANLHNARRAHSPVVNVVGDHASWHLAADPPLASDITALAGTVGTYHQVRDGAGLVPATRDAIRDATEHFSVSTLIVPADFLEQSAQDRPCEELPVRMPAPSVDGDRVEQAALQLRRAGPRGVLLLGGAGLTRRGQRAAGKISAATGAALYSETFPARAERGGGLPAIDRLPYFPEAAIGRLRDASAVILAGAAEPVSYFGYPGTPSRLAPDGAVHRLAGPGDDAEQALSALADAFAGPGALPRPGRAMETFPAAAALTGESAGSALASWLPEHAIVTVEGGTCGYPFYTASAGAAPHTVLTNTGGAIGQGLPAALGAAIAAPDRPVIALQSDGSALYTAQALWTMARESANVIVLIAANHAYGVLRTELRRQASTKLGTQAARLTSLGNPPIDWDSLARGLGVTATTATTVGELRRAVTGALDALGPHLIQMVLR